MNNIESLAQDVKEIRKNVNEISIHTARNTVSLETHMARTEASEKRLDRVENSIIGLLGALLLAGLSYFLR